MAVNTSKPDIPKKLLQNVAKHELLGVVVFQERHKKLQLSQVLIEQPAYNICHTVQVCWTGCSSSISTFHTVGHLLRLGSVCTLDNLDISPFPVAECAVEPTVSNFFFSGKYPLLVYLFVCVYKMHYLLEQVV